MPNSLKVLCATFFAVALCPVLDIAVLLFILGTASFLFLYFRGRGKPRQ